MSWIHSQVLEDGGGSTEYVPCSWSTGTDAEIVEALEKHYAGECNLNAYWSVGDERVVNLSAMTAMSPLTDSHMKQDVTLVLLHAGSIDLTTPINGHTKCAFVVGQKESFQSSEAGELDSSSLSSVPAWVNSSRRTWCNTVYYNAIPSTLRPIFKQFVNTSADGRGSSTVSTHNDYFSLLSSMEITFLAYGGDNNAGVSRYQTNFEYYASTANQLNLLTNGSIWTRSASIKRQRVSGNWKYLCGVIFKSTNSITSHSTSSYDDNNFYSRYCIAPFGVI